MGRPFRTSTWILTPAVGAAAGLLYGLVFEIELLVSAVRGAFIAAPVLLYKCGLLVRRWRDLICGTPTPIFAAATLATYVAMIILGNAVAGTILHHGFGYMENARVAMRISETGFIYALGISALATFVFRVRDLMGPRVFASLLVGRYHRPITEERIFLFLDVAGSTQFADEHGDMTAQRWLGAIFNALALPVHRSRGSIDDCVGDMALVSWSMERGLKDAACLRCVFDFLQIIGTEAERWRARFGQVPAFRAALHCGTVFTAEIGLERRKIAYFGDALNTTSRLEGLAMDLDKPVVVSDDLLDRLGKIPHDILVSDLGSHSVRGRSEPLRIAAVCQRTGEAARAQRPPSYAGRSCYCWRLRRV